MRNNINNYLKLYYVTDQAYNCNDWLLRTVEEAILGGVTMVQLREKNKPISDMLLLARKLKALLKPYKVPLIINDSAEICKEVDADGVHLGQSDMHPDEARKLLGERAIIGLSLENMQQAELANQLDSIDYVAASPVFATLTKLDCSEVWGLDGLKQLAKMSKHPVVVIGGINLENVAEVINAGAIGVAVVSCIQSVANKNDAAVKLRKEIERCLSIARH